MELGDTFINLNPGSPSHFWIVISTETSEGWVIVNLTTHRDGCEEACILDVGDHHWIRRTSVVHYIRSSLLSQSAFKSMHELGVYDPKDPLEWEVLRRVQKGALDSLHMKKKHKEIVRQALISDPTAQ